MSVITNWLRGLLRRRPEPLRKPAAFAFQELRTAMLAWDAENPGMDPPRYAITHPRGIVRVQMFAREDDPVIRCSILREGARSMTATVEVLYRFAGTPVTLVAVRETRELYRPRPVPDTVAEVIAADGVCSYPQLRNEILKRLASISHEYALPPLQPEECIR